MVINVAPATIGLGPINYFKSEVELAAKEQGIDLPVENLTPGEIAELVEHNSGLQATVHGAIKDTSFTPTDFYRAVLGLPLDDSSEYTEKQVRTTPLSKKEVIEFHRELGLRVGEKDLQYLDEDEIRRLVKGNLGLKLRVDDIAEGNSALIEHLYAVTAKYIATGKIDLDL